MIDPWEAVVPGVPALEEVERRYVQARAEAAGTPAELAALVELATRLMPDPHRRGELAREGIALATALGDKVALLRCRAMAAESVVRHTTASDALPEALDTLTEAQSLGDPHALAHAHHTVAVCFKSVDCPSEAFEHGNQALHHYRTIGDRWGEGRVLTLLGVVFDRLGENAEAVPLYQQAHDVFIECDDLTGAAVMLCNLAERQHDRGDPTGAVGVYESALELFERAGTPLDTVIAMRGYACSLAATGQRDLAAMWLKRAAARNRLPDGGIANYSYELDLLMTAATSVYVPDGDLESARDALQQAAELAAQQRAPRTGADVEAALAEVLRDLGDLAGAYQHAVRSRELIADFAQAAYDERVRALRVRFEVEQAQREVQLYRERAQAQSEVIAELERTRMELADRMGDLQRLHTELLHLSQTDPLTGLANRRHMNETFARLCRTTARSGTPLALAMFDVDRFKNINDRYGHDVGDSVLITLTDLLRRHLRATDVPARLGGDEFVVVMPGVREGEALVACRRLQAAVREHPWEAVAAGLSVTITVGVVDGTGRADPGELLLLADRALYRGKQAGRDIVVN